jgi:hypothetical protein
MKRREFIMLLGSAVTWPLSASAQRPAMPVIGIIHAGLPQNEPGSRMTAFRQGLNESGYVEGQNVTIEYRWAEGQQDRYSELVADLIRRKVSVIATGANTPAKGCDLDDPDRLWGWPGSGEARSGRKSRSTGRQRDGCQFLHRGARSKAARAPARNGTRDGASGRSRQSGQRHEYRVDGKRCAVGCPNPRIANSNLQGKHQPRDRRDLYKPRARADRCPLRRSRSLFQQPACAPCRPRDPLWDTSDLCRARLC